MANSPFSVSGGSSGVLDRVRQLSQNGLSRINVSGLLQQAPGAAKNVAGSLMARLNQDRFDSGSARSGGMSFQDFMNGKLRLPKGGSGAAAAAAASGGDSGSSMTTDADDPSQDPNTDDLLLDASSVLDA